MLFNKPIKVVTALFLQPLWVKQCKENKQSLSSYPSIICILECGTKKPLSLFISHSAWVYSCFRPCPALHLLAVYLWISDVTAESKAVYQSSVGRDHRREVSEHVHCVCVYSGIARGINYSWIYIKPCWLTWSSFYWCLLLLAHLPKGVSWWCNLSWVYPSRSSLMSTGLQPR